MDDINVAIKTITFGLALLGAVLGIMNTWRNFDKDRVKLRVTPKTAIPFGDADSDIDYCIEVVNLSGFTVTVNDAGFFYYGTKTRATLSVCPLTFDNGEFPRRLEPRTAFTLYGKNLNMLKNGEHKIKSVFATTDCGVTISKKSKFTRSMNK